MSPPVPRNVDTYVGKSEVATTRASAAAAAARTSRERYHIAARRLSYKIGGRARKRLAQRATSAGVYGSLVVASILFAVASLFLALALGLTVHIAFAIADQPPP